MTKLKVVDQQHGIYSEVKIVGMTLIEYFKNGKNWVLFCGFLSHSQTRLRKMKWILDSLSITNKDAWALVLHIFEYTVLTRAYPVLPR